LRQRIFANRQFFPPDLDLAFVGAWIENESDGRRGGVSRLGEVGYFQLHPAEISDIAGKSHVGEVVAQIQASADRDLQWGGALLRHYDSAITRFQIPRGTRLYHALLKVMHSSRPRGIRWLEHVRAALGRNPQSYREFLQIARLLYEKQIPPGITKSIPSKLPSCAPGHLLARREAYLVPGESRLYPGEKPAFAALMARGNALAMTAQVFATTPLGAATTFPGVSFQSPLPLAYSHVVSGWRRPRPQRNGWHQGMDLPAPEGTPVLAVESGTVEKISHGEFAGLFVALRHAAGWVSRYLHLHDETVEKGQRITKGQVIGHVGRSGVKKSGSHLHFDMLLDPALLDQYARTFGMPRGGFGKHHAEGTAVPSEPLIPVASYTSTVIQDAKKNGVPLYQPAYFHRPFPAGKAFAGFAALALASLIGLHYWQIRKA